MEQTEWTWDEILDNKGSWTWEEILAGEDRLPWRQVEIAREERRRYEGTRLANFSCLLWGLCYWSVTVLCGGAHSVSSALF
jgi:hypothetical protein